MEGRARRAMELLALAEISGRCGGQEREAHVNAARAVLCEEFNDVRLYWRELHANELPYNPHFSPLAKSGMWELVAAGPGGDFDRCTWSQVAK